jgi:hypothetical protein
MTRPPSPLGAAARECHAVPDFEEAYIKYRLGMAGAEIGELADKIKAALGEFRGGEILLLIVRSVDTCITHAIGETFRNK